MAHDAFDEDDDETYMEQQSKTHRPSSASPRRGGAAAESARQTPPRPPNDDAEWTHGGDWVAYDRVSGDAGSHAPFPNAKRGRADRSTVEPATAPPGVGKSPALAATAHVLLAAAVKSELPHVHDAQAVRDDMTVRIRRMENLLAEKAETPEQAELFSFLVCTFVDYAILQTRWAESVRWDEQQVSVEFHDRFDGGDIVFDLIDRWIATPGANCAELTLAHQMLSLGFVGNVAERAYGSSTPSDYRRKIMEALQSVGCADIRGAPISAHAQSDARPHQPIVQSTPIWVIITGAAAALTAVFASMLFSLVGKADRALRPLEQVQYAVRLPEMPAPPLPSPTHSTPLDQVHALLAPDISDGRVVLTAAGNITKISLRSTRQAALFRSGGHVPSADYRDTLERVTRAVGILGGTVTVEGHSDNQPLRTTAYGGSNVMLSMARANSIRDVISDGAASEVVGSVQTRGYGPSRPLANIDPDSAEGRRQNRRVDILIHSARDL